MWGALPPGSAQKEKGEKGAALVPFALQSVNLPAMCFVLQLAGKWRRGGKETRAPKKKAGWFHLGAEEVVGRSRLGVKKKHFGKGEDLFRPAGLGRRGVGGWVGEI